MADEGQLSLDRRIFRPGATVRALRDSRYRHEANAIAELIDNSIDAGASCVELLIEEERRRGVRRHDWRVSELAVIDNGRGMGVETLVEALCFGGRHATNSMHEIGKYGMGLPTASASQCERVDVWTWQESVENPAHSYLDIAAIAEKQLTDLHEPDGEQVPSKWLNRFSTIDRNQGTLVVWSKIDRITKKPETIFQEIEREIGRIHRHFINDEHLTIRMAAFRTEKSAILDRILRPNDPLFLMGNSASRTPDSDSQFIMSPNASFKKWDGQPMFRQYMDPVYLPVNVDGREETVEILYSIVRFEALGRQPREPGHLAHGRDARMNMGVSIVRENRELLLENAFVREGGRGDIPMNRWWGCELRFNKGCDDVFGVDHNKQMAATLSNAAREMLNSDSSTDDILAEISPEDHDAYRIVAHIRDTTRNMLMDVGKLFDRRRSEIDRSDQKELSPQQKAEQIATEETQERVQQGYELTETDRRFNEMSAEEQIKSNKTALDQAGVLDAAGIAKEIVDQGIRYRFVPAPLAGYQMFHITSPSGTMIVQLNNRHDLYAFLQFLEKDPDPRMHRAASGLLVLLLAWARMQDQIEEPNARRELEDIAMRWGRQAAAVLSRLNLAEPDSQ